MNPTPMDPAHTAPSPLPHALDGLSDRVEEAPDGCLLWRGRSDRDGYGVVKVGGRDRRVHRLVWERHHGRPVPDGQVVRHACDRPDCVSPAHLAAGTPAQNVADRQARDRQAKGSRNGRSRLNERQVAAAKRALADGALPKARLARLLGVDPTVVRDIDRGRTWGHVDPE